MLGIDEDGERLTTVMLLDKNRNVLGEPAGDETVAFDLVGLGNVQLKLAKEHLLKSGEIVVVRRAVDNPIERLRLAVLFKVAAFGALAVAVGRQKNNNMAPGLHDLVERLLLRHTEKDAHAAQLRPPTDVTERGLRSVRETDLDDILEYPGVLGDAFR